MSKTLPKYFKAGKTPIEWTNYFVNVLIKKIERDQAGFYETKIKKNRARL